MARTFSGLFRAVLAVCGALVLSQGCNIYTEDIHRKPSTTSNNYEGGVGWWSHDTSEGCFTAGVPLLTDRPASDGANELEPIYLALSTLRLGGRDLDGSTNTDAWKDFGFDLDGVCTGSDTCNNATADGPPVSCKTDSARPDGVYCRDNMLGLRVGAVETLAAGPFKISETGFNCSLCQGNYNMMVRISGYNGLPNDDQVRIDLYPSPGIESNPFTTPCTATADEFTPTLCWEKSEAFKFKVDKAYFDGASTGSGLPNSKYADANGYVREGYVVIQVPDGMEFWFPHGLDAPVYAFPFKFHSAIVVARIDRAKTGEWALEDGTVAGKLYEQEILDAFGKLGLCSDNSLYPQLTTFAGGSLDVPRTTENDPTKECEAMSFGIRFTAREALPGSGVAVDRLKKCDGTVDPI
ncbi:MAG: hypothetical protein U0165_15790 [Polyangiaceae bacterium]